MGLDMYLMRTDKENKNSDWENSIEVGYWRKANQIHNWFVNNVQGGVDDCDYYEVSDNKLIELLERCKEVVKKCRLVEGDVVNGFTFKRNEIGDIERVPIIEKGFVIEDPSTAKGLLPTSSGFFFGSTSYDEYYLNDIKETIELLERVLNETDFDTQKIVYCASW